ncbi:GDP-perosamine synthase [Cytophagales bacterium WSM2-2]|nr:GDP-perosamine synthase [Cytophagales bacterium WSM2-2]
MNVLVNEPLLDGNEKKYLNECIDTGWISSEGPFIKRFEETLANYFDRKFAIAVSNGTVAIDIAIDALELKSGDEIILPSFTIISCISGLIRKGCVPVFIDQDAETWNMDVRQIKSKITSKTKAIMVVHIYGLPVDMTPVLEIAKQHNLLIIEDSAEMHGQTYNGRKCGSFGDISTLSFYPNKHITTGEGGMVLTDDAQLAERCRSLRNLCFVPERRFVHYELGYNARMTNLQAAVGLAQFERIEQFIVKKRWIGSTYQSLLKGIDGIRLPLQKTEYADNIYWVFGVTLDENLPDASDVMKKLAELGVGTRPFFWGLHEQPVLKKYGLDTAQNLPVCEYLSRKGFYLPSGLALKESQIIYCAEMLKKVMKTI